MLIMGLRISSGKLKGRKIKTDSIDAFSESEGLRPTSARVREAVFNILMGRVEGVVFLDLYAGTGAIGVEAMSRGAADVYFVEADARAAAALDEMLSDCGCRPKAHIVNASAVDFLRRAEAEGMRFDVVYLDPPYASGELPVALELLGTGAVLNGSALVLAEHRRGDGPPDEAGRLKLKKKYHYGDTSLKVYNLR